MLRRLFRLAVKLGLVGAIGFAVVKKVQGRAPEIHQEPLLRAVEDAPPKPTDAWTGTAPVEAVDPVEPAVAVTDAPVVPDVADLWVAPDGDGGCPSSHPIKAKLSSSIFHQPGGLTYERTRPDRCYLDASSAEADGLRAAKR